MNLVLNNVQRLICHKTQTNNQPNKQPTAPLQRGKTALQLVSYDTKQSNVKVPVMLELWGVRSIAITPRFSLISDSKLSLVP